jgi:hypothetical protein
MPFQQDYEIFVLADDDVCRFSRLKEDLLILSTAQSNVPDSQCSNIERLTQPLSNPWGQVSVEPHRHTVRTGWSMRRLANIMQALRSSASKSGISAKICAASRPDANRSRTSLTRIRIPRTQGRPPHCRGLTVILSIKFCISRN